MSPASDQNEGSATFEHAHALLSHDYTLQSDLARLCLPAASQDEYRKLAWVNSICCLFLVVGLIGVKTRPIVPKTLEPQVEVVPVVFTTSVEEQKPNPEPQLQEPELTQDPVVDTPQVATVVAADPAAANFPVPVEGPVTFAPARFAAPPPPSPPKPQARPNPTVFIAGGARGIFPDPPYPSLALRRHYEGKVMLYVVVNPNGSPASVEVKDSSGYPLLDDHSSDWVKSRWRWPAGEIRHYLVPFVYQIR